MLGATRSWRLKLNLLHSKFLVLFFGDAGAEMMLTSTFAKEELVFARGS